MKSLLDFLNNKRLALLLTAKLDSISLINYDCYVIVNVSGISEVTQSLKL